MLSFKTKKKFFEKKDSPDPQRSPNTLPIQPLHPQPRPNPCDPGATPICHPNVVTMRLRAVMARSAAEADGQLHNCAAAWRFEAKSSDHRPQMISNEAFCIVLRLGWTGFQLRGGGRYSLPRPTETGPGGDPDPKLGKNENGIFRISALRGFREVIICLVCGEKKKTICSGQKSFRSLARGAACWNIDTQLCCRTFGGPEGAGGGGQLVGVRGSERAPGGGGTPTYMPQNDPHDASIILGIHEWGFFPPISSGLPAAKVRRRGRVKG